MRTTHTYATLELTQLAFDEIKKKLEKAGYQDQFHNEVDGLFIDMHGIAVFGPEEECEQDEESTASPAVKKAQLVFKQQLQLKDAAMLIARLSHALAPSASHLKDQALDWLKRNDLAPSILR